MMLVGCKALNLCHILLKRLETSEVVRFEKIELHAHVYFS